MNLFCSFSFLLYIYTFELQIYTFYSVLCKSISFFFYFYIPEIMDSESLERVILIHIKTVT